MKESELQDMRNRWADGRMSMDEWNKAIEEHLVKEREERAGRVTTLPLQWNSTYDFPVNESYITEDFIRRYANAIGDPNPLYHDLDYGRKTRWGSIIAPPILQNSIASPAYFPDKPGIPGWNTFYGGTEHRVFKVIRPGDRFKVVNKYLGTEEKDTGGRPYRLFNARNQRTYLNHRDEIVGISIGNEIITATPPGKKREMKENLYGDRQRKRYTDEELAAIHQSYEDELAGRTRRGAEILYWEDVVEGEEMKPLLKGPLDISDIVSFIGAVGYIIAFAQKYRALQPDMARAIMDPETGEAHNPIDWHYQDAIAQVEGLPYAHSIGRQNEALVAQLISNWMGDDGFLTNLHVQHRGIWFQGETVKVKGKVTKKHVDNNEHLVDLDVWTELPNGKKCAVGYGTVRLLSRTH